MGYLRVSSLAMFAIWTAVAGGGPLPAPAPTRCTAKTVCDRTLGIALKLPASWTVVPPGRFPAGTLAFWTRMPGTQEPPLHLVIDPLGPAWTCSDAQAVIAVADVLSRTTLSPRRITRRSLTVGGTPAIMITGLPGSPTYGLTIVIAHQELVYRIDTFGSTVLTLAQRHSLTSLQFIARSGPFPSHADPTIARVLRTCTTAPAAQLSPGSIVKTSSFIPFVDV